MMTLKSIINSLRRAVRLRHCPEYTVTGNGVAHRTADSYMRDEKVQKALRQMNEQPTVKRIAE